MRELIRPVGGSMEWSSSDSGETVLSVDVENKSKVFDCRVLASLSRLHALRILGGKVERKSLSVLPKLPQLGLFVVTGSGLVDADLKWLGKCKALYKLDFGGPSISAKGLRQLEKATSLRRLFLYNTELKDGDLHPLGKMIFLGQLVLPTTVSAEASQGLGKQLQKTQISRL